MNGFPTDAKQSIRRLSKSPGFTITAVVALALGIGTTVAIFSLVNTVLLKPLPVIDSDRLVMPASTWVNEEGNRQSYLDASPAKFEHWRTLSTVLRDVSAFLPGVMNYKGGNTVEQWHSIRASADFFRCWRMSIVRGRTFTPEEDLPNAPRVALISRNLWSGHFASDPRIVGQTISLDGESYSVIGIVADSPGLREFGPEPEVYVPLQLDPNARNEGDFLKVVARLQPGVALEQANARVQASVGEYRAKFPKSSAFGPKDGFTLQLFREALVGDTRRLLWILLSAVALVLLTACANVANLLLMRATGRGQEIAIRAALGAPRARVIRELLTESVMLSIAGGLLGLLLGYGGVRALLAVNTADLPLVGQDGSAVTIDWRVMAFALAVSLATGVLFGLMPAFQISRVDLASTLRDGGGRSGTGLRRNKARAALVVSETAVAMILLVGSALLIRSFAALYRVDRGFETKNVVTMRTSMTSPRYLTSAGMSDTIRSTLVRLRSLPGAAAVSATCCLPLVQGFYGQTFEIVGRPQVNGQDLPAAGWSVVSPGFFEVLGIPTKRGRMFSDRDGARAPQVVVINERMAKEYWSGSDPLLDRIIIGKGLMKEFENEPPRQIIGIVGDVRNERLNANPLPMMYVPQAQIADAENAWLARNGMMVWVVRTRAAPRGLALAIRKQLMEATGLPVSDVRTMDELVSLSTGKQRLNMLLMSTFGCCALLLAAVGIFGLMAYTVEQRRHEIGIRLALGARASHVRNMVVRQGMSLAVAGIAIGSAGAWALSRWMESLLFEVRALDPMISLIVPTVLGGVALLAVWLPASAASRLNAIESLRYQ